MASKIHVTVLSLTGERLEIEANPETTICCLKYQIAELWHVPHTCPKLVIGTVLPKDNEILAEHCKSDSASLTLTVVATAIPFQGYSHFGKVAFNTLSGHNFAMVQILSSTTEHVCRCRDANGKSYIAKGTCLPVDSKSRTTIQQEIALWKSVARHPNLIAYHDSFMDDDGEMLFVVMSDVENESLHSVIIESQTVGQTLVESVVLSWIGQILSGLKHLHRQEIAHRDLHPSNIFLCAGRQHLCIGPPVLTPGRSDEQMNVDTTMVRHLSPELMRNEEYAAHTDMWALGCICFELCTLDFPFQYRSLVDLAIQIIEAEPDWSMLGGFSKDLQDVTQRLLKKEASDRPTAVDLLCEPLFIEGWLEATVRKETWPSLVETVDLNTVGQEHQFSDKIPLSPCQFTTPAHRERLLSSQGNMWAQTLRMPLELSPDSNRSTISSEDVSEDNCQDDMLAQTLRTPLEMSPESQRNTLSNEDASIDNSQGGMWAQTLPLPWELSPDSDKNSINSKSASLDSSFLEMTPTPSKCCARKPTAIWADYVLSNSGFQRSLPTNHERLIAELDLIPLVVTSVDGCDRLNQDNGGQRDILESIV